MTIPTQAQAERAAALAGHNVPATCHTDRRCWSCCYCGQAFPKKRTAAGPSAPDGFVPYWDKACPHCGYSKP